MQLELFPSQARGPLENCPRDAYMCPGSCGFALWSDPQKRIHCMYCDEAKLPWKGGCRGDTPPAEGAPAP